MQLFSDYLQPLTTWIYNNPNWALFFTFLISFSESLAVIGSFIPGSVTMTAIGILAGSGVMRIDATLLAATLGAIAGDGISYLFGYYFRNSLHTVWPFSRYPRWLNYGKEYFANHGGKSVLIGRFIGPIRAVIPVIAGMMHMNKLHFFIANIVSAIGWSLVFLLPGILIGAAGSELSAEAASRLFFIVLLGLVLLWLLSLVVKWLLLKLNQILKVYLDKQWKTCLNHPRFKRFALYLTPSHEVNHYLTLSVLILFFLSLVTSVCITLLVAEGSLVMQINQSIHFFFQTLQTSYFDAFFIIVLFFIQPISLVALFFSVSIYLLIHYDWRTLAYWMSLALMTFLVTIGLNYGLVIPIPETAKVLHESLLYPQINLAFATVLFCFLILYISTRYRTVPTLTVRILLVTILLLAGLGSLYLANNWLTGVLGAYSIGLTLSLGHWIFYRRKFEMEQRSQIPIITSCTILILTSFLSYYLYYSQLIAEHHPRTKQYVLTESAWWNQAKPLLPTYTTNRLGHHSGIFNIQYLGNIESLRGAFIEHGWRNHPISFFYTLLERVSKNRSDQDLPLIAQLYNNKKPLLIMSYRDKSSEGIVVIRLWRSNFHVLASPEPIWLGSMHYFVKNKRSFKKNYPAIDPNQLFTSIEWLNDDFKTKMVRLQNNLSYTLPNPVPPLILLVKESKDSHEKPLSE